jgi:RNA polymerase sigma factor (sigma-70 family)
LRDPTEAEDALQATFLLAFRSLLKGTVPREPGAWLATIARNECWGRVRSRMREPLTTSETEDVAGGADPLTLAMRNEDVGMFWAAFRELPGPQQRAFLLREFGGLSYDELALALGVSGPAVESLLFRARRGLRTSLATVATLPLALRDLLAQFGTGAAATGVAVKAATVTVGVSLVAVTATGLHATHHVTHVPRVAAAPIHARRAVVPASVVAPAPAAQSLSASAGRRPRRLAPASETRVAFAAVEAVSTRRSRGEASRIQISARVPQPAQVAPADDNKPSAETDAGHGDRQAAQDGGGDRQSQGGGDHHGEGGRSGDSGQGGD